MAKIMVAIEIEGVSYDELRQTMQARGYLVEFDCTDEVVSFVNRGEVIVSESLVTKTQRPDGGTAFVFELIGVRP